MLSQGHRLFGKRVGAVPFEHDRSEGFSVGSPSPSTRTEFPEVASDWFRLLLTVSTVSAVSSREI